MLGKWTTYKLQIVRDTITESGVRLLAAQKPLDCKEIQPVHPKGNQSWVFIGRTDVEAETPVFLPGESQGEGSLVGCRLWGRIESDTTEVT